MEKIKQVNLYALIAIIILLVAIGVYFFISQKEKPSSIDDFINKTKITKNSSVNLIGKEQLTKLEPKKVDTIDTKDPFKYKQTKIIIPKVVTGVTANIGINELSFVGVLSVGDKKFAIIELPNKKVYKFTKDEYISKDAAQIYQITDSELILLETRQDITGSWITDKRVLKLKQDVKKNL